MTNKKLIFGTVITIIIVVGIIGLFLFGKLPFSVPPTPIPAGEELSFETINSGPGYSNEYAEKKNYIITNSDALTDLWQQLYSNQYNKPPMPKINFQNEMAIAVFMGTSGGADRIKIDKIIETGNNVQVLIIEEEPAIHCGVIAVITYPFHFVKLQKGDKEIIYKTSTKIVDCN